MIATASPDNHAAIKELGAQDVFDYKDESTPAKIAEKYPDLQLAVDCFSEKGSTVATANAISKKGGKVVNILPTEKAAKEARPDIEFITTLVYSFLGREFKFGGFGKFSPEQLKSDHAFLASWVAGEGSIVNNLMEKHLIKGNKIKVMSGGLDAIPEGMKFLEEGKVRMEKLAYDV